MCRCVSTCLLVWLLVSGHILAQPPEAKKILLIGTPPDHPWGSHMYMFDCHVLAKCLENTAHIKTVVSSNWPKDPKVTDNVAAIVFYSRPAGVIVLAPKIRPHVERLLQQGTGYVAIHWATCVGYTKFADEQTTRDDYKNILGGWFRRPPSRIKIQRAKLSQVEPDHPISLGWNDFTLRDEFYLDLVFHDKATPLITARIEEQDHTVAWTFERPDSNHGRSFGTVLGHFHDNFQREEFRRLLVNGILWSAHVNVPTSGAPVEVNADELTLPARRDAKTQN